MSSSQPTRCFLCAFVRLSPQTAIRRQFHTSLSRLDRQHRTSGSRRESAKNGVSMRRKAVKNLSKGAIEQNYTAKQAEAIRRAQELGYADHKASTTPKVTPWSLDYFDDFTQVDPVVDKPVKSSWTNIDETARLKTEDELTDDLQQFMENLPKDDKLAEQAWTDFEKHLRLTVGKEESERSPRSALAPEIPKLGQQIAKKATSGDRGDQRDTEASPALLRLMQMTGYNQDQMRKLRVKTLVTHRVVNQTRLGKISRTYTLSIAGNGNGLIGIGEGKSEEAGEANLQSQYRAIRNMQPIMRYENRTIFGEVEGKSGATELQLFNRPPGFGLRCPEYVWEISKCAGIHDLAARVTRAQNPMNTVKATVQALLRQKDPDDIARARGKKLVDVRKVYYAGNV